MGHIINRRHLKDSIKKASAMQLTMTIERGLIPRFYPMLGQGFVIKTQMGYNIKNLLCLELGIDDKYIEQRIQTIFLNGKAVDDIDSAIVDDGSTLALSGSMPGLVGATLRRGGFFAAMRSQISHHSGALKHYDGNIRVTLKLFNLVAKELGPDFLQRGLWLKGKQLQDFLSENFDYLQKECKELKIDGQVSDIGKLSKADFTNKSVFLKVMIPEDT
jgi:hypothetical protein